MAESLTVAGTIAKSLSVSRPAVAIARGHISIFYPALIILDIYVSAWALLIATGQGGLPIINVVAILVFSVVPLLFVYACLRFMTVSVIVTRHKIVIRRGWPHNKVCSIAREDLRNVRADFSYFGKLTGAGALTITTRDGTDYRVRDIASPDKLADRLNAVVSTRDVRSRGNARIT